MSANSADFYGLPALSILKKPRKLCGVFRASLRNSEFPPLRFKMVGTSGPPLFLFLGDCNWEGFAGLLGARTDRRRNQCRHGRVHRSEGEGNTLIRMAEEVPAVGESLHPAAVKRIDSNVACTVRGVQREVPRVYKSG